jgi:hypothetical protein
MFAFTMVLAVSPARAGWLPIASTVHGSIWSIDPDRLKTVGDKRQAWVEIDHSKDRTVRWRRSLRLFSFDCATERYKMLSYVNYDSYGKVVSSNSITDYGFSIGYEPIIPESMVEAVFQVACLSVTQAAE